MTTRIERGRKAYRLGHLAETRCVWYLRLKGYRILSRRFKTPVGEIDIVARHRGTLVFVEVKARADVEAAAGSLAKSLPRMQRALDY
jgi:putative endonuclease